VEVSRYCLDTVAYSHFKRGEPRVVELLDRAEWIGVPVVVIGELCAGFGLGSRLRKNLADLDEFLSIPVVNVLPVDRHVAGIFGEIVVDLRRRGRPIPVNDIWIAATCANAGATLVTFDAHFATIQRIGTIILE
jgi:predicted nucleic acid-binding protein